MKFCRLGIIPYQIIFLHTIVFWMKSEAVDTNAICGHAGNTKDPCFDNSVSSTIEVTAGDTASLPCFIYNVNFTKIAITWFKDIAHISIGLDIANDNKHFSLPRLRNNDWTLVINDVNKGDNGTYYCQINHSKFKEKEFNVIVKDRPKLPESRFKPIKPFIPLAKPTLVDHEYVKDEAIKRKRKNSVSISGDSYSNRGDPVSFSCVAEFTIGESKDAAVAWFLNSEHQMTDRLTGIDITMRWGKKNTVYSVLTISKVGSEHAGDWTCTKESSAPQEQLDSATFTFSVHETSRHSYIASERIQNDGAGNNGAVQSPRKSSNDNNSGLSWYSTKRQTHQVYILLSTLFIQFVVHQLTNIECQTRSLRPETSRSYIQSQRDLT